MKPATTSRGGNGPLWRRLAWFVAIWGTSVMTLGIVAYMIRLVVYSINTPL